MLVQEQLRDPLYAFRAGEELAAALEVGVDPLVDPVAYAFAIRNTNPRTEQGKDRFQLEEDPNGYTDDAQALIMATAGRLGILETEYPYDTSNTYDALVVIEGARSASLDRAQFAVQALRDGVQARKVVIVGSNRDIKDVRELAVTETWAPKARNGFQIADAAYERIRDEHGDVFGKEGPSLEAFHTINASPDTKDVVFEVMRRREGLGGKAGSLLLVTTALYVPFKTHLALAVSEGSGVSVDLTGVASRPEIVQNRTTKTYLSEVSTTLNSAAQHYALTRS